MPSAKASKQRRRAARVPPPVRSKGALRRRQPSPRLLIGAGVVVVAVVLAVALAVVLSGGSSNSLENVPAVGSLPGALPGAADVQALFKGVPQTATTLGPASAPVTLVEFIDPQCPYCQQFETQVLPGITKNYVRSGTLRIEMEPWAFIGPDSIRGQAAILAAARQDKAFNYSELLYDNQGTGEHRLARRQHDRSGRQKHPRAPRQHPPHGTWLGWSQSGPAAGRQACDDLQRHWDSHTLRR